MEKHFLSYGGFWSESWDSGSVDDWSFFGNLTFLERRVERKIALISALPLP